MRKEKAARKEGTAIPKEHRWQQAWPCGMGLRTPAERGRGSQAREVGLWAIRGMWVTKGLCCVN